MLWHSTRRNRRPVRKSRGKWIGAAVVALAVVFACGAAVWFTRGEPPIRVERILAAYQGEAKADGIVIREPLDGTLFPPDMIAPTFRWDDPRDECNLWLVTINFSDGSERMSFPCLTTDWTPSTSDWQSIKRHSLDNPAAVTVLGVGLCRPGKDRVRRFDFDQHLAR